MISISTAALMQMKQSAATAENGNLPLRIAIKQQDDGSFHYAMGFDAQRLPGDSFVNFDGLDLVVSENSTQLAAGMTIDFVELTPGQAEFIFLNPNDPTYVPPNT